MGAGVGIGVGVGEAEGRTVMVTSPVSERPAGLVTVRRKVVVKRVERSVNEARASVAFVMPTLVPLWYAH